MQGSARQIRWDWSAGKCFVIVLFASNLPCRCKCCTDKGLVCGSLEGRRTWSCPACVVAKVRCIRNGDKDQPTKKAKLGKSTMEVIDLDSDEDVEPTAGSSGLNIRLSRLEKNTTGPFFGSETCWLTRLEEEMSDRELMLWLLTEVQELRVEYRWETAAQEALVGWLERRLAVESEGHVVVPVIHRRAVIRDLESAEEEEEGLEPE